MKSVFLVLASVAAVALSKDKHQGTPNSFLLPHPYDPSTINLAAPKNERLPEM